MVRPLGPNDSSLLGGDRHVDEAIETIENRCAPFYEAGWRAALAAHPDDGHAHSWGCRRCGVDPAAKETT